MTPAKDEYTNDLLEAQLQYIESLGNITDIVVNPAGDDVIISKGYEFDPSQIF
jgi:hypothetical protein